MRITDEFLHDIKKSVNVKKIAEYFGVKVYHNKALCPFHDDHNPSLSFKGDGFKCFACGEKGDVFTFIQKYRKCDFPEAVRIACEIAGIPIPGSTPKRRRQHQTTKPVQKRPSEKPANQLPESTRSIYRDFFDLLKLGETGRQYLTVERGLSDGIIHNAQLRSIEGIEDARRVKTLLEENRSPEALIRSGLFSEKGLIWYKSTIVIPYFRDGEPVYFSNRFISKQSNPKSRNMAGIQKLLYCKQREHDDARAREVYVFEGIFDALSYWQMFGQTNFIAVNESISIHNLERIREQTDAELICVFDNDKAGDLAFEKLRNQLTFRRFKWDALFQKLNIDSASTPIKDFNDLLIHWKSNRK